MKKYDTIVSTFTCSVPMLEDASAYVELDLLIVLKDGKYGLEYKENHYTSCISDLGYYTKTVIPCIHDNLFCDSHGYCSYLIMVNKGKQGMIRLQISDNRGEFLVIAKEILPSVYDQIVNCLDTPAIILLYQAEKVLYYDTNRNIIGGPYDSIQGLYYNVWGCWNGNQQQILCCDESITFYQPEIGWKYDFFCRYEDGCIFKVSKIEKHIDDLECRLVFYSDSEQKIYKTKLYDQISFFALDDGCGCLKATEIHLIDSDRMKRIKPTNIFVDNVDVSQFVEEDMEGSDEFSGVVSTMEIKL